MLFSAAYGMSGLPSVRGTAGTVVGADLVEGEIESARST